MLNELSTTATLEIIACVGAVRQFEELLDCETPRPERDPDGSSDGQAADTERPPSPPLIHLPKDGDGDTSPSTNARPDSEVGKPSHDTAASSSDSRKGKAAEGSRLQDNGRRGSAYVTQMPDAVYVRCG
jgi:hypothetical protein